MPIISFLVETYKWVTDPLEWVQVAPPAQPKPELHPVEQLLLEGHTSGAGLVDEIFV